MSNSRAGDGASPRRGRSRLLRLVLRGAVALVVLLLVSAGVLWAIAWDAIGSRPSGERLERIVQSPQWSDGAFRNRLPRVDGPYGEMLREFVFGGSDYRFPVSAIPTVSRTAADFLSPPASGLRVTWLGHSTLLLEIDGQRVLIDPVWGERVSPFTFLGPKRFYQPPLALDALPAIDAVVISHDHYDHLDMPTVKALITRDVLFVVPLGVGSHLEHWGVPPARIRELDWWDTTVVGEITLTATPARHFSGRGVNDAGATLWSGWAITTDTHRVYYSGDTSLDEFMAEIGTRLGPFDLTMIEAGAYDALWADVHLGPEQAVRAHQLVRGKVLLPVHWGLFDLALHGWTEPIERVLVAAEAAGVAVATPRPGESVEPSALSTQNRWWPMVPWRTVADAPAWSSGTERFR